jgi:hypothetical protein
MSDPTKVVANHLRVAQAEREILAIIESLREDTGLSVSTKSMVKHYTGGDMKETYPCCCLVMELR